LGRTEYGTLFRHAADVGNERQADSSGLMIVSIGREFSTALVNVMRELVQRASARQHAGASPRPHLSR